VSADKTESIKSNARENARPLRERIRVLMSAVSELSG